MRDGMHWTNHWTDMVTGLSNGWTASMADSVKPKHGWRYSRTAKTVHCRQHVGLHRNGVLALLRLCQVLSVCFGEGAK